MTIPTRKVAVNLFEVVGTTVPNGTLRLTLLRDDVYTVDTGGTVPAGPTNLACDANGLGNIFVFPNALGTQGTRYQVDIFDSLGAHVFPASGQFVQAFVPDQDCLLEDIIFVAPPLSDADMFFAIGQAKRLRDLLASGQAATAQAEADYAAGTLSFNTALAGANAALGSVGLASSVSKAFPNSAASNVPKVLQQSGVGAITPGAGGTNGTFALALSGGSGWLVYPTGTFTVAGNVLTAVTITDSGLAIGAAVTAPTASFAASAGLTGAAVALTPSFLPGADKGYWVQSADGLSLLAYQNVAGVATAMAGVGPIPTTAVTTPLAARPLAGVDYAVQDGNGNASMTVSAGVHKFASLDADVALGYQKYDLQRRLRTKNLFFSAALVMQIIYGQSLSLGQAGTLNTLSNQGDGFFDCLMFNANGTAWAGPRAQEGTGTADQNHASLIAYEERPVSGSTPTGNGETSLGNAFRMQKRLLRDEDGINYTDFQYQLLGSAPGVSNTAIAGLSKGTPGYTNLIADVTYGLARAQDLGVTFAVDVIYWSHGERDAQDGTSRATYLALLQQLYTDLNTDIKAITGQAHDIKMIGYQCTLLGAPTATSTNVALAQLDMAKANPNYILATATYIAEHFDATNVHCAGTGYPHIGAYYGLAAKRMVNERQTTWPTMYPQRIIRTGKVVEAEWPDTGYPLAFSTTFFDQVANQGFSVVGTDGVTDNPIVSVALVGPKSRRVRITLTNALPGKLRYGFTALGGNLHDTCDIDPGLPREVPMYAPSLIFEESFA
jgi:hypothetical protein